MTLLFHTFSRSARFYTGIWNDERDILPIAAVETSAT